MEVSSHYDPMLAKIIVHADDRTSAIRKMARALSKTQIIGINTNKHFLQNIVQSEAFSGSDVTTAFIEQYAQDEAVQGSLTPSFSLLAKAALLFTLPRTSNHDVLSPPTPTWQHSTGVAYPIDLYCNDVTTSLTVTDEGKHFRICHPK